MSQSEQILQYLEEKGSITPLEALNKFGCFRLGARIFDLKKKGYPIESKLISSNGKEFAQYTLIRPEQTELFNN